MDDFGHDPQVDDLPPLIWLDAFPWLRGASTDDNANAWWEVPIAVSGSVERVVKLERIAELAIERLSQWTIGQIFPGLPPSFPLTALRLPVRAGNVLARRGISTTDELSLLVLDEIMDWRNVGIGTVSTILQVLAECSMSISTTSVMAENSTGRQEDRYVEHAHPPVLSSGLIASVREIAMWQTAIGLPAAPLLGDKIPAGVPPEIRSARGYLEALSAKDVLQESELELDAAALLDNELGKLDSRAVGILQKRVFADKPATLDELGIEYGFTRERARQIEGKARAAMLDAISSGTLHMVANAARALIGTIRPLTDLVRLMPALNGTVQAVNQPVWRVIDRLDDAYQITEGWCVVPTLTAAREWTAAQLQERTDYHGVGRLEELDLIECSPDLNQSELTAEWLRSCGYIVDDTTVLTRTASVGDYAAAILFLRGSPMTADEIIECFAVKRTAGSLKNAMTNDERFERVDRKEWALAEWGMEAYAGIRSVIRKELAKAGGAISINRLVEHITGKYSVSSSSVMAYASTPPFELRGGMVKSAGMSRETRKPPARTPRLYRRGDEWIYRVRINHDHLRGSGSVAPVAIAAILGMAYGDKLQLASELGDQSINWTGTQPAFGTIRRFLLKDDISADTEVFLRIRDDRSFDIEVIGELSGDPLADALALIGVPSGIAAEEARRAFAAAIQLPEDSPVVSIIGGYRDRGESDVADSLTTMRHYLETGEPIEREAKATDVHGILDLL
ncbi:hypothetical protein IEU95_09930 [Hoyosella rhizosphaerae]|uniref:RNA polymerase alpha subunit C-terminal domain-containing protein n=1 Tax=Hoyosella rhizosphaerae TaxID=1755582 RepID=A0A916X884_9ACTN|nr:sigma factor-like helix-turn-helix DNA-binding protein [Hoyosella rhizosphaerae]MBN4927152.1 hypothetical protein [Hoyosella rhizosphaerae]GGC53583.1 hypothetical protein GCM10011410_02450 [Hoyosella rhizosphaerae]